MKRCRICPAVTPDTHCQICHAVHNALNGGGTVQHPDEPNTEAINQ